MSNLSVNTITNAAGGNTAQINGMTPTGLSLQGFRNRLFNGNMVIDQRNNGASVSTPPNYTLDRWKLRYSAGTCTVQRSTTAPAGFNNSFQLTVGTARTVVSGDRFGIEQPIEGFNIADLGWGTASAQSVTLSFWVRSSLTGTFGLCFSNFSRGYAATYTISAANTWEYKTVTIVGDTSGTWDTTNGTGVLVVFDLGMGSDVRTSTGSWQAGTFLGATGATNVVSTSGATFQITGCQLEAGAVATPFERRPFGAELALCQRYYEKSYNQDTAIGAATINGYSTTLNNPDQGSAVYIFGTDVFAVVKRSSATMRFWDLAGNANRITNYTLGGLSRTDNNSSFLSYTGYQRNAVLINIQAASTVGTYQWDASAEL